MTYFNPDYLNDPQAASMASRFAAPSQVTAKNSMAPMTWPWQQQQQAQPPAFNQNWTPPVPQQASSYALGQSPFSGNAFPGSPPMMDGSFPGSMPEEQPQGWSAAPWSLSNPQFQPQQQAAPVAQAAPVQATQMPMPNKPPSPLDQIRQQMLAMKMQQGNMQPQEFATQMRALYNQSMAGR